MLYAVLRALARVVLRLGFRLRATGVEHVPLAQGVLLAANHQSFLDPPAVGAVLPRPIHFMAKAELFRVPGLGWLVARLNAHPVERGGADASALRTAVALLRGGQALLVFPEGTRGHPGTLGRGRAGVGLLAAVGGAPVVPVYVTGTGRALPRGAVWPRPTPVRVVFGAPLRFDPGRGKDRYQAISDEIMAAIGRLMAEVEGGPAEGAAARDPVPDTDRTARGPMPAGQIQ